MTPWSLLALAVYALTRGIIYFRYDAYVTDIPLYQAAGTSARQGLTAYCDYWFPYPPLSLPLVFIPAWFGNPSDNYRTAFRAEMLLFDALCFAGVWFFVRDRLKPAPRRFGLSLAAYGLMGLAMGHLLFDRLDAVMSALFIWSLYFFTSDRRSGRWTAYALLLAGALVKLLPLFLLPVFMTLEAFSDTRRWPNARRALRPILAVAAPFALVVGLYDVAVCQKLIPTLAEQGSRGIQIESNWALPLIVMKVFRDWSLHTDYIYGAFHIVGQGIPPLYLLLSKYVGFVLLLALYVGLARRFLKSFVETERLSPVDITCLFYLPLLVIICGQRVLSPQYVIWLMPLACVQMASARRPFAAWVGCATVFALTYIVFDIGFFPILSFHPWYSMVLLVRNIALALWMADLLRRVLRALRLQRSRTIAGL